MRAPAPRGTYAVGRDGTLYDVVEVDEARPMSMYLLRPISATHEPCGQIRWHAKGEVAHWYVHSVVSGEFQSHEHDFSQGAR